MSMNEEAGPVSRWLFRLVFLAAGAYLLFGPAIRVGTVGPPAASRILGVVLLLGVLTSARL